MATIKKAQAGGVTKSTPKVGMVDPKGAFTTVQKRTIAGTKTAKNGGSFPDLNKDGKITKADILKGRGVIAKKGVSVKKSKAGGCMSCGGKMKKK